MYLMAAVTLSLNLQAQVDLEMLNLRMDNFEFECLCAEELSKEQKKHIKSVYLKPNWCDQNMLNTESLNNWLEGFDSLEILIFRDMPVDAIPDRVFELEHLEVLIIWCDIIEIDTRITLLDKLRYLELQAIGLETIPEALGHLKSLEELSIYSSKLRENSINIIEGYPSIRKIYINNEMRNSKLFRIYFKNLNGEPAIIMYKK